MSWVCPVCSNNNLDTDEGCLLCGTLRPAPTKDDDAVCTLTKRRAAELSGGDLFIPTEYNVIGEEAFKGRTDITAVYIHAGVRNIKRSAFEGCAMLSKVQSDSKLNSIGARAFAGCTYLCPERRPTASRVASDAYEGCSATYCDPPPRPAVSAPPRTSAPKRDTALRSPSTGGIDTSLRRPTFGMGSSATGSSSTASAAKTSSTPSAAGSSSTSSSSGSSYGYTPPPTRPVTKPEPKWKKRFSRWTDRYKSPIPTVSHGTSYHAVETYLPWLLAAILAFGIGLGILMNFGHKMTAESWQYAFGIPIALGVTLFTYLFLLDCTYEHLSLLHAGAVGLSSVVLLIFGDRAIEFVTLMSLVTAFTGICAMLAVFNNGADRTGFALLGLSALSLAMLIYLIADGWYLLDSNHWQLLVAMLLGLVFVLATERLAGDDYLEIGITLAVHFAVTLVSVILALTLRDRLAMAMTVLPLTVGITSCACAGKCLDDYEEVIGGLHIALAVVDTAIAVCVQLFYAC